MRASINTLNLVLAVTNAQTAGARSLPLGAVCSSSEQCVNGAECYGITSLTIPTCGPFQATCTADSQCATNTCIGGFCIGVLATSSISSTAQPSAMSVEASRLAFPTPSMDDTQLTAEILVSSVSCSETSSTLEMPTSQASSVSCSDSSSTLAMSTSQASSVVSSTLVVPTTTLVTSTGSASSVSSWASVTSVSIVSIVSIESIESMQSTMPSLSFVSIPSSAPSVSIELIEPSASSVLPLLTASSIGTAALAPTTMSMPQFTGAASQISGQAGAGIIAGAVAAVLLL